MDRKPSVFDQVPVEQHVIQGNYFFVIQDRYPVSPGHCLIVSREPHLDFFDLNELEREELLDLVHLTKRWIKLDYFPDGFNIGMNCGRASGQTVMHFHCHVIPRYNGDMEIPDGGIRHCIDGNGNYKTEE